MRRRAFVRVFWMATMGWEPVSANRRLRGVSRDWLADIRRVILRLNLAVESCGYRRMTT